MDPWDLSSFEYRQEMEAWWNRSPIGPGPPLARLGTLPMDLGERGVYMEYTFSVYRWVCVTGERHVNTSQKVHSGKKGRKNINKLCLWDLQPPLPGTG